MKVKKISLFFLIISLLFSYSKSYSQGNDKSPLINSKLTLSNNTENSIDNNLINSHFKLESPVSLMDVRRGRVLPLVTVHLTGGYSAPFPDLKGTIPEWARSGDTLNDPDAGQPRVLRTKAGINFGGDVHIAIGKKRQFRVVLSGGYVMFGHSQDNYRANNNFIYLGSDTTTVGKLDIHINAVTIGLGAEWAFRPFETMDPFIGLDLTGHFYNGKVFLDPAPSDSSYHELKMKSASRFGIAVGGGVDFAFGRAVGVVVGVKYNFHNLLGKSAEDTTTAAYEFGLIDKEYTDAAGNSHKSQNLSDIQFYGGVSFYFGQPPRKTAK